MIFSTVFGPQEPAFTVGSFAISATGRPRDRRHAGDDAVGAEALLLPVREQRVLDERVRVHEPRHAVAHRQLALVARLLVMALRPASARSLERVLQV